MLKLHRQVATNEKSPAHYFLISLYKKNKPNQNQPPTQTNKTKPNLIAFLRLHLCIYELGASNAAPAQGALQSQNRDNFAVLHFINQRCLFE